MLVFPNCKINLGLHVVNKRPDGYHAIETVLYPLGWHDALEIIEGKDRHRPFAFEQSGRRIDGPQENNLVYKAWKIISQEKKCPPVSVHLYKNIPMGAGLGGGSSDAVYFINALDQKFELGLSQETKIRIVSGLGSDCAFFIKNLPVFAVGKGDEFTGMDIDLSGYYILAVHPSIHSNTKEAYEGLAPGSPAYDLKAVIAQKPVRAWKDLVVNDFEASLFKKHPEIKALKDQLYAAGALYASMSGSGSAVFGIFEKDPNLHFPTNYSYCLQKPAMGIL